MDSGFCVLKALIKLASVGVLASAVIKNVATGLSTLTEVQSITRLFLVTLKNKLCSNYIVSERGLIDNIKSYIIIFIYTLQFKLLLHFKFFTKQR
jgi:hypothetical protein